MNSGFILRALLGWIGLLVFGCAGQPNGPSAVGPITRMALAPVRLAPQATLSGRVGDGATEEALIHVGHYLADELQELGIEVVTSRDAGEILGDLGVRGGYHSDASHLARAAVQRLNVDSLLLVELIQWAPRLAPDRSDEGAAVAFRATLHGGRDGRLLWTGMFRERQLPFFRSPWRALRYPERGTRWLEVTELARWGARQMSAEVSEIARRHQP